LILAYAQVQKLLGNCRIEATCFDGKTRLCHIRGKMRNKVWIATGDIILIGLRDYQDDKVIDFFNGWYINSILIFRPM
jgi:translation initiation factor 1A